MDLNCTPWLPPEKSLPDRGTHGNCSLSEEFVAVGGKKYRKKKKKQERIHLLSSLQCQRRSLLPKWARIPTASSPPQPPHQPVRKIHKAEKMPLPHHVYLEEWGRAVVSCQADLGALTSFSLLYRQESRVLRDMASSVLMSLVHCTTTTEIQGQWGPGSVLLNTSSTQPSRKSFHTPHLYQTGSGIYFLISSKETPASSQSLLQREQRERFPLSSWQIQGDREYKTESICMKGDT